MTTATNLFSNISSAALADEYGELKERVKGIEKRIGDIKAELAKRGVTSQDGEKFSLSLVSEMRTTLDTARLKADLGEDIIAGYEKITTLDRQHSAHLCLRSIVPLSVPLGRHVCLDLKRLGTHERHCPWHTKCSQGESRRPGWIPRARQTPRTSGRQLRGGEQVP